MYSSAIADQNYLRGVQIADSSGRVSFTSIFPACYSGRWPHIHVEVYLAGDVTSGYTVSLTPSVDTTTTPAAGSASGGGPGGPPLPLTAPVDSSAFSLGLSWDSG